MKRGKYFLIGLFIVLTALLSACGTKPSTPSGASWDSATWDNALWQ